MGLVNYGIYCTEGVIKMGRGSYIGPAYSGPYYQGDEFMVITPSDSIVEKVGASPSHTSIWHAKGGNQTIGGVGKGNGRTDFQIRKDGYIEISFNVDSHTTIAVLFIVNVDGVDTVYRGYSELVGDRQTGPLYSRNNAVGKKIVGSKLGPLDKFAAIFNDESFHPVPAFPGPDNEKDPSGGDGDGELEDTPIEFPEEPGLTVTDAGLMTLYTPTQGQIHAFGDFLWSDAFSLDTFKKLFADPMQAVIGLSIVPVAVPTAGAQPITIGAVSSGVTANRAASQYVVHDCGTLTVKPVWNTALDFSPYTKFSIYLPFIGTRELKTDDIMGKELNVKYFVDVLSGACTAHISVGGSVLYQFSGSCATPVPLSAMNWNSTLTSMIQLAGAGIAMAVTGGAAAPAAAGMLTTATGMIGNKPNVQRSGAVSGAAGMLGVKTPYLIRETPRQSLAKDYAHYSGYPSNITAVLGDLQGFTMVENMHLKNIDATADELDEIETALKEGVIL